MFLCWFVLAGVLGHHDVTATLGSQNPSQSAQMAQSAQGGQEPAPADTTVTGPPGKPCGDKRCLKPDARCEDRAQGICECKGSLQGDGYLSCNSRQEEVCAIHTSSIVTNFNNDRPYRLITPCRFLAAYIDTREHEPDNTHCLISVFAHGERVKGRFFLRGFDTSVVSERDNTSEYVGYRARGERTNDDFTYILEKRNGPDDFWQEVNSIDHNGVQFGVEDLNARVELKVDHCGLTIVYRPEDKSEGRDQSVMPGLVIKVDKRGVDVTWPQAEFGEPVCLTPTMSSSGRSAADEATRLNLTQTNAMNYIAFTNTDKVLHGSSPCDCEDVSRTLKRCRDSEKRRAAFDYCQFILDSPPFVLCMETRGSDSATVTALYNKCLEAYCLSSPNRCRRVQEGIAMKACQDKADQMFINFSCPSLRP